MVRSGHEPQQKSSMDSGTHFSFRIRLQTIEPKSLNLRHNLRGDPHISDLHLSALFPLWSGFSSMAVSSTLSVRSPLHPQAHHPPLVWVVLNASLSNPFGSVSPPSPSSLSPLWSGFPSMPVASLLTETRSGRDPPFGSVSNIV